MYNIKIIFLIITTINPQWFFLLIGMLLDIEYITSKENFFNFKHLYVSKERKLNHA